MSLDKIIRVTKTKIPTNYGNIWFFCFNFGERDVFLISNKLKINNPLNLRIHSACITSEIFGSLKCDCKLQLDLFLNILGKEKKESYALIYFPDHEGRGIGIFNKIKVYEVQRKLNLDTYDANKHLKLPIDARDYKPTIEILRYFKINKVILYTNNPNKFKFLKNYKIDVIRKPHIAKPNSFYSLKYLQTKIIKGGHLIDIENLNKIIFKEYEENKSNI
jgi:GTP cyclohydrolase II